VSLEKLSLADGPVYIISDQKWESYSLEQSWWRADSVVMYGEQETKLSGVSGCILSDYFFYSLNLQLTHIVLVSSTRQHL
jgi:hypothetical protein